MEIIHSSSTINNTKTCLLLYNLQISFICKMGQIFLSFREAIIVPILFPIDRSAVNTALYTEHCTLADSNAVLNTWVLTKSLIRFY